MRDLTSGLPHHQMPRHFIKFGEFDSSKFKMLLQERTCNTPAEKAITANLPFRQGEIDFSHLMDHRIYENRELHYVFYLFNRQQRDVNAIETTLTNLLMTLPSARLDDSFELDYYYRGKCQEVVTIDEYEKKRIRIELTFNVYPFKIAKKLESSDDFNSFNFDLDVFQDLEYIISEKEQRIVLYNTSQLVVRPSIFAQSSGIKLHLDDRMIDLKEGRFNYSQFKLKKGSNEIIAVNETDTPISISFNWRKERI